MESKYKIAVIGGTGKSGQFLVIHLLKLGIPIKMLIRNPENFQLKSPLIEIIRGDARDPRAVYSLIEGCNAVISTLGQPKNEPPIFSDATRNVNSAMDFFRIRRYIVTTGINVDTPQDKKTGYTEAATEWMKDNYPKTTADKQTEWELLVASALDWTLVRLPYIELTDKKNEVKINLEDCPGEKISATSLAEFLTDQLNDTTYSKQSPFISNGIS
ncbi:MAG TPA: NAD(P)H-binding protein [Puia sp.]|jgi:putative NADH-flavin reductase|nr:NAD(P)H-binding protein [Puia sp.]